MVAAVDNRDLVLHYTCIYCGTDHVVIVNSKDYWDWMCDADSIQNLFHYLSPADRELMLTNTCGQCFNEMFLPDVDNDD